MKKQNDQEAAAYEAELLREPSIARGNSKPVQKIKLDPKQIRRVYTGLPGCACGCRGNYSTNKATITKVLKKFAEAKEVETTQGIGDDGMIFFWDIGERTYTIYMKKA